jgi:transposase
MPNELATDVECTCCGREHEAGVEACENCGNLDFREVAA